MTTNFDGLRKRAERLPAPMREAAEEAALAVGSGLIDPPGAAWRARRVTEGVLQRVVRRKDPKTDVHELEMNQLKQKLGGAVPANVMAHVDTVQRFGNMGAHQKGTRVTKDDAYVALNALLTVLEWEARTYHPTPRRRSRWPWVLAMLGIGGSGMVVAAAGLLWVAIPGAETQTAAAPAPAPLTVAEPVAAPIPAVTPTPAPTSSMPVWSRPLFPWERPEDGLPAGTTRVCGEGTLAGALPERVVGTWVRVVAWCDGTQVQGWTSVTSMPTVAAMPAVAQPGALAGEARAWFYEGAGHADAGDWAVAIPEFDKVVALVPNDPVVYERRGVARLAAGDAAGALGDLALCVSLAPRRGTCFFHAAEAYKSLGDQGWRQVLADATAYDATLTQAASAMRAVEARDLRVVGEFGDGGLPMYNGRLNVLALRRARDRGSPKEICRLRAGDEVEVTATEGDWHAIRARCGGVERAGFVVTIWKNKPTLRTE